ncbi:hypothetical protein Pan44_51500 [Caulifigura coniformis]|uniref:VWFA domain-containing protein n=1 Tax=Caulifigura coniformis TaxID=2527983 RepID=A0A517SLT8_9PLAN|nr:hypothetical protein [Caulifigura coniformis]QDT57084.1 hypothetical protein Pan44_51500 [Caulifigura coniformis]
MKPSLLFPIALMVLLLASGCIESPSVSESPPFDEQPLSAVLAIQIDLSGSFSGYWDDKAYRLFLDISDRFFQEAMGKETKLVISQLSGNDKVLLFEGRPSDLRKRFKTPQELNAFLKRHSDASGSRVYDATTRTLDYVGTISGVSPETKLLTVILSDMQDSDSKADAENRLRESLRKYQERGGALALYFVAESERERWNGLLNDAGFRPGYFVIESELTSSPRLPRFE